MTWLFSQLNRSKWVVRAYLLLVSIPVAVFVVLPIYVLVHVFYLLRDLGIDIVFLVNRLAIRWKIGYLGDVK